MRENTNLVIYGEKVTLVPYREEHVEKYHEWMQDPWLQETTASEPLTLEEEYSMQKDWAEDPKNRDIINGSSESEGGLQGHTAAMAGDVNLYWNDVEEPHTAEIEIMVAEAKCRGKGVAHEALTMFMAYAATELGVNKFRAKIGEKNIASISLFEKLGFVKTGRSEIFKEVTLELQETPESDQQEGLPLGSPWARIVAGASSLRKGPYDPTLTS